jgi:hypothetical protein
MLPLSKERFSRAIEGSDRTPEADPPVGVQSPSRRISRFVVIALIVAVGIGAGWAGGKFLNGRMNRSTAAALPGDVPAGDNSASETQPHPVASQPQPESQNAKVAETTEKPVTPNQPAPDTEKPVTAAPDTPPKEVEPKKTPPEVPQVEKDEDSDKPTEDPAKEIGRKALKKINRELNNSNANSFWKKVAAGNKNENKGKSPEDKP